MSKDTKCIKCHKKHRKNITIGKGDSSYKAIQDIDVILKVKAAEKNMV